MYKMYTLQRNAMHIEWSEAHTNTVEGSRVHFLHPQRLSNVTNVLSETAGGPCLRPQQSKCWKEDLKTLLQQEQASDRLDVCPTLQMSPI